jgi:hypothetical protein
MGRRLLFVTFAVTGGDTPGAAGVTERLVPVRLAALGIHVVRRRGGVDRCAVVVLEQVAEDRLGRCRRHVRDRLGRGVAVGVAV